MRRLTLRLLLVSLWLCAIAAIAAVIPGQIRNTITLTWDYDTNAVSTDFVFKMYSSTNILTPIPNWTLVAVMAPTNRSLTISNLAAKQCWFYITASNWWGESLPSNVAGTPSIPSGGHSLRISL